MLRLAVVCVVLVTPWAAEQCHDRQDDDGLLCDADSRYCPKLDGKCVDNKCECQSGRGQPELICSNDEDFFSSVINDPIASTMNNREGSELPVPCMYLLSHVKVNTKTSWSPRGRCNIKVNLYNQRHRGKMFVGGFEIQINCRNTPPPTEVIYKADARVNEGGQYCYDLRGSIDGGTTFHDATHSAVVDNKVNDAAYTFEADQTTNSVRLQIPIIGLTVQLRPFDPQFNVNDQKWMPGFGVKFDNSKEPEFKSDDTVVSLIPGQTIDGVTAVSSREKEDEMIFRAFTGSGNRNSRDYPNSSRKCGQIKRTLNNCLPTRVPGAMKACRVFLVTPKFINCFSTPDSGEVDTLLSLYKTCVRAYCEAHYDDCMDMVDQLDDLPPTCKENIPISDIRQMCWGFVPHPV